MNIPIVLIAFVGLTSVMSIAYLSLLPAKDERFMRYWGFAWLAYSCSLLCVILSMNGGPEQLYIGRQIFDMMNIVLLLLSAYAFARVEIPGYWLRFALYLGIWLGIGMFYSFDVLSVFLPAGVFGISCTFAICRIVYLYWGSTRIERFFPIIMFGLWGCGKAALSLFYALTGFAGSGTDYLIEALFSNMLNYAIVIIYIRHTVERQTQSEKNFRTIAENATDIIFFYALKPTPSFVYVTPSAETMTGYPVRDFYADPKFYLKLVPAEEFEKLNSVFDPDPDGGEKQRNLIFRMIHMSGIGMWAEVNSSLLFEKGEPVAVEGIIRDISLMKSAEEELIKSKEARDHLLSYVSHELRLPLSSILGYAEALRDNTIIPAERGRAMDVIYGKAQALSRLIDDLFQLSKLETGQFSFNFTVCEVAELTRHLKRSHAKDAEGTGVRMVTKADMARLPGAVIVDRERISQVLSNLITNGVKFSESGGTVTLCYALNDEKTDFTVSVSDTGEGISEQDLPRVFDRFFTRRVGGEGKPAGSGLGLTLCKEIVEAHNGRMSVESKEGAGSTFTFTIPLYFENE
jgi:PAS domain S-box-containing protein